MDGVRWSGPKRMAQRSRNGCCARLRKRVRTLLSLNALRVVPACESFPPIASANDFVELGRRRTIWHVLSRSQLLGRVPMYWFARPAACLLLACTIVPMVARGQEGARPPADAPTPQVWLQDGLRLEQQRNWIGAIQHYERAVRLLPNDEALNRRLLIARLHYDVTRRLNDLSILEITRQSNAAQVLELYSEVLARIEMSYVEPVDMTEVVRGGTAYLEVALTEPEFIQLHLPDRNTDQIERFRTSVHRITLANRIRNRFEARAVVARAVEAAEQQLNMNPATAAMQFVFGAVSLLDPYSSFLSSAELQDVESQIEGNFVGLGVALQPHESPLRILSVIRGGPAQEAGLRAGDRILEVGSVRCEDVGADRAADLLRGPEGSRVRLLLQRDGEQEPFEQVLMRRRVEVPSVENVTLLDAQHGIGYLKISSFQKTTATELDNALWTLHRQGMRSLIMDLRGNPGGWLDAAVAVADRFLDNGGIVTTRGKNGIENQNYTARPEGTWRVPLLVLIDSESASASEILAGAIRDNARGTLIGQTTYGKGSVQGLFHTRALNCGLRLTVSKFYSPTGRAISRQGVAPNIPVDGNANVRYVAKVAVDENRLPRADRALEIALAEAKAQVAAVRGSRAAR
ncbi:MAG: S41 family peptidase [Planctomycetota bacterium]|nr:MAG: S41 family peptidase [Planctomycetota bacterium]